MKIYYTCALSALIALCLISFVVTVLKGGKGARIAFCIISALCVIVGIVLWLISQKIIVVSLLTPIVDELYFEAFAVALAIVGSLEMGGLLCKKVVCSDKSKNEKSKEIHAVELEYEISSRKRGERIHGEYTIVKK